MLCDLVKLHKPDIILLFETIVSRQRIEEIRVQLQFECFYAVYCIGRNGGIGVLWRLASLCSIVNLTINFVNLDIVDVEKGTWRLTAFYGCPQRSRRKESWSMLRGLATSISIPWSCVGDFNDLLSQDDKFGLHEHSEWCLKGFRETMQYCNLMDLPLTGYSFTWSRRKGHSDFVEERLDRAFATSNWLSLYPNVQLVNAMAPISDHTLIFLIMDDALVPV